MWKKDDVPAQTPAPPAPRLEATPSPEGPAPAVPIAPTAPAARAAGAADRATIGRSITIKGEVSGDEDLLIQGRVDGSVALRQHLVTVGAEGEVKASISGRVVTVEGRVEGDVSAQEQIILRSSAWVEGNIAAPRVVLEDGARFRGGVDMGEQAQRGRSNDNAAASQAKRVPETAAKALREPGKAAAEPTPTPLDKGKRGGDTAAASPAELTT